MKTKMLLIVSMVGLMCGCDLKKAEITQHHIDSLRRELRTSHEMAEAMAEIGSLIDSIDANRGRLRIRMAEGTNFESYVARMRDINQWVRRTERRVAALEKTARRSNDAAFKSVITKLKADLDVRNHELAALSEQVKYYQNQNEGLVSTVSLQKAEIEDKLNQIRSKQLETAQLEEQVKHLLTQSRLDQGDAYFARAVAVEETARRTKFAPRKKKNSEKQALELYKLALLNGNEAAVVKITALEKKYPVTPEQGR